MSELKANVLNYKIYQVGGSVRDELSGKIPSDYDYVIVLYEQIDATTALELLRNQLTADGYRVFHTSPEHWTIRCKFPKDHSNHKMTADFQLSVMGNVTCDLMHNLRGRDFTINSMAKDVDTGEIIDPFNGQDDLGKKILTCPVSAEYSFSNDPIRIIRALRFWIMNDFNISTLTTAISHFNVEKFKTVAISRLQREIHKMMKEDTMLTLDALMYLKSKNFSLYEYMFTKIKLNPVIIKSKSNVISELKSEHIEC